MSANQKQFVLWVIYSMTICLQICHCLFTSVCVNWIWPLICREERVRRSRQHTCLPLHFLLPLRATGNEKPHTVQCGLRRTRPATKSETWALTESVENYSHRGRSFCIVLWFKSRKNLNRLPFTRQEPCTPVFGGWSLICFSVSSLYSIESILSSWHLH